MSLIRANDDNMLKKVIKIVEKDKNKCIYFFSLHFYFK